MKAQHVVKSNVRWRIGNGNQMCIWGEPWLCDEQYPYIMSPMLDGWENATISLLKSAKGNVWNFDMLRQLVNERDKNLILKISLNATERDDYWQWLLEKRGLYF